MFEKAKIMITGGTGSFGNTFLKKLLTTSIAEIRIFSRDEMKQDYMRHLYNDKRIKFIIGDIRDPKSINDAIQGVDYVFCAAALKQVPVCEFYPLEAVYTNILGTANTIEAAITNKVKKVVVLSTDKAVYPINAMGMSKALMEKVMLAKARQIDNNSTILCATRYGNVIGSRGSVIPLFIQQIKQSQPITVTDPNMTRFMMTLDQAIDLVIYAFENCSQGDIFVQKAPAATIGTLAQALIEIFEVNLEIKIIGPRHGEKVFETLLSREEAYRAIDLGNYFRVPLDYRDLNYSKYLDMGSLEMSKAKEYTSETTKLLSKEELKSLLLSIDFVQNELKGFLKDKRYI